MALSAVRERFKDRGGDFGADDDSFTERTWLITTNNKHDTALQIKAEAQSSTLLPRFLEPHPLNVFYTCRRLAIRQIEGTSTAWEAIAVYASNPLGQAEQDRSDYPNPLARPTRTTTEGVLREKYVNKDRDGIAFTNSAGDYFPAQVVDDDRVVIGLVKNVPSRTSAVFSFSNSVNDADYTVDGWEIAKGCGKIGRFKYSELQEDNGYFYYILTAEIQVLDTPEEWDISLLDEGFNAYDRVNAKYRLTIVDDNGDVTYPSEPLPLDGLGRKLDEEDPQYGDGGGVFRSWHYYREKHWQDLPF